MRSTETKHVRIVKDMLSEAQGDRNVLGFFLSGSVAEGTHTERSDMDAIMVFRSHRPGSGMKNARVDGIKTGVFFMTSDVLVHSVENVLYLLHPVVKAKLLFDRDGSMADNRGRIAEHFDAHPEAAGMWERYYALHKREKAEYGHEMTTIADVWNDLEIHQYGGKIKRRFFNSFLFTNPVVYSLLKKLFLGGGGGKKEARIGAAKKE